MSMSKVNMQPILDEWAKRVDVKAKEIANNFDKGLLKAALFCEGEAKKNAMEMIYNTDIPSGANGKPRWKRTGLYKAAIGSGIDANSNHSAIVFNTAPYARIIEYGSSDAYGAKNPGRRGRPIITSSIFNNKPQIKIIIEKYLKEVVR